MRTRQTISIYSRSVHQFLLIAGRIEITVTTLTRCELGPEFSGRFLEKMIVTMNYYNLLEVVRFWSKNRIVNPHSNVWTDHIVARWRLWCRQIFDMVFRVNHRCRPALIGSVVDREAWSTICGMREKKPKNIDNIDA